MVTGTHRQQPTASRRTWCAQLSARQVGDLAAPGLRQAWAGYHGGLLTANNHADLRISMYEDNILLASSTTRLLSGREDPTDTARHS